MNFLYSFFAFVFSLTASWLLVAALIPYLKRDLLDLPNHRSSHIQPTPSGGGISFVLVSSFSSILSLVLHYFFPSFLSPLLFASLLLLPLSLVGFVDDRVNLPSSLRYLFQLGTAFFVVNLSSLAVLSSGFILFLFLIITVTAVINFVNFMDGLDGLVAGCMSLTIAVSAIHLSAPWVIWSLVGALIGFLIFNWCPARIFMGDVGSTFLGAMFSVIVLQSSSWVDALSLLLVASPLLFDAFSCVIRRLVVGQPVHQPHRLHLYQRLHQSGMSHGRVSILYILATSLTALCLLLGGFYWVLTCALFVLLAGIWLDQQVAVPFAVSSRS